MKKYFWFALASLSIVMLFTSKSTFADSKNRYPSPSLNYLKAKVNQSPDHVFVSGPFKKLTSTRLKSLPKSTTNEVDPVWSGYQVVPTSAFGSPTAIVSTYTAPTINCNASTYGPSGNAASFWVGLDSNTTSDLEQTGISSGCENGTPYYFGFYENYPIVPTAYTGISMGDSVTSSVTFSPGSNRNPTYYAVVHDNTNNGVFAVQMECPIASCPSPPTAAEVITEDTGGGTTAGFNLTNFSNGPNYTNSLVTDDQGVQHPLGPSDLMGYWTLIDLTLVDDTNNNQIMSQPTPITGTSSTSFDTPYKYGGLPYGSPPSQVRTASFSGTPVVGSNLTAQQGRWSGTPTPLITDIWQRCIKVNGQIINSACSYISYSNPYTVQLADAGTYLRLVEIAQNVSGTKYQYTNAVAVPSSSSPFASTYSTLSDLNSLSSLCLAPANEAQPSGTNVEQVPCNTNDIYQYWNFEAANSNTGFPYRLVNAGDDSNTANLCLDVPNSATTPTLLKLDECNTNPGTYWFVINNAYTSSGYKSIENNNSQLCVEAYGSSSSQGIPMIQNNCGDGLGEDFAGSLFNNVL